ncbi:MAG: stage II sporulation protein P [Ruminococcaceae bacterium]|nr:stage II sporulation protein P [Oscillospiraceae bacterium]
MKKIWILFIFPAIVLCFLTAFKGAAESTARLTLSALHPLKAVKYVMLADNASAGISPLPFFPHNDDNADYENPFEGFELEKPAANATPQPQPVPDFSHPIVPMTYTPVLNDVTYKRQNCYIKNVTQLSKTEVEAELLQEMAFKVEKNSSKPQILIMHTHATESYQNWNELYYDPAYTCRDTDVTKNMVSVGKIIADKLNDLGYNTLHDATLHDYPNYNGSYDRSKATVESYLTKYPSIKVVLDVHRDAIERTDGTRIKPVVTINGKQCAQVMIISGADNGYLNMPNFKKNLRFASHLQNSMETLYPGFTRPVLFDYRNYNQQLTTGSLLIEVGGHANTLEEAQNAAKLIAYSLAHTFDNAE